MSYLLQIHQHLKLLTTNLKHHNHQKNIQHQSTVFKIHHKSQHMSYDCSLLFSKLIFRKTYQPPQTIQPTSIPSGFNQQQPDNRDVVPVQVNTRNAWRSTRRPKGFNRRRVFMEGMSMAITPLENQRLEARNAKHRRWMVQIQMIFRSSIEVKISLGCPCYLVIKWIITPDIK